MNEYTTDYWMSEKVALDLQPAPPPPLPKTVDDDTLTEAELACSYKLARHVPDMARGFTICTSYGEMCISGPLAQRMQAMVREALANELAVLGSRRK